MSVASLKLPVLRHEVSAFLEAERLIRAARRTRIETQAPTPDADAAAVAAIDAAIGQLVAARHTINAATAAPSKEL